MISYIRAVAVVVYSIFLVFSGVFSGYGKTKDTVNLQLKWTHQFQFAGYYAAQIKGYYAAEGLEVIILDNSQKKDVISEVAEGNSQYGVTEADIISRYVQKTPVKVLAAVFQHTPYAIISPKHKKITKPTDLSGKKVMVGLGISNFTIRALLHNEGIPLDSVKILPFNKEIFLAHDTVDAIVAYKTSTPIELRRLGIESSVIQPADYGVDFYGGILFTSDEEVKKNAGRVEKFLSASLAGWEYALQHPEEIIDYVLTLPGVKENGIDRAFLQEEALIMNELIRPNLVEVGHMNKGRWAFILKNHKELGLIESDKDISELLYEPEDKSSAYSDILICIIVFLLIFAFVFIIRSVLIKRTLMVEKEKLQEADFKSRFNEESIQLILEHSGIILWNWNVVNHTFSVYGNEQLDNKIETIDDFKLLISTNTLSKFDLFLDLMPNDFSDEVLVKVNEKYEWRLLTIKARSYDPETNAPINYTGMLTDISDLKRKEEYLEKISNELQKTNTELEKFAYITSHNLRAPVVNLESLVKFYDYDAKDATVNNDLVTKMDESVRRLKSTLEDLVEVVSKKSEAIHLEQFSIKEEILNLFHRLGEGQEHLDVYIEFAEIAEIVHSKSHFRTIFENLISNSIKFRKPEGILKVRVKSFDAGDYVGIEIEDNGIGIDMEKNKQKIFGLYQKFQMGIEGKGLGLFIVKSQVESLDGKIEVNSKLNIGTTFRIYFRKQT